MRFDSSLRGLPICSLLAVGHPQRGHPFVGSAIPTTDVGRTAEEAGGRDAGRGHPVDHAADPLHFGATRVPVCASASPSRSSSSRRARGPRPASSWTTSTSPMSTRCGCSPGRGSPGSPANGWRATRTCCGCWGWRSDASPTCPPRGQRRAPRSSPASCCSSPCTVAPRPPGWAPGSSWPSRGGAPSARGRRWAWRRRSSRRWCGSAGVRRRLRGGRADRRAWSRSCSRRSPAPRAASTSWPRWRCGGTDGRWRRCWRWGRTTAPGSRGLGVGFPTPCSPRRRVRTSPGRGWHRRRSSCWWPFRSWSPPWRPGGFPGGRGSSRRRRWRSTLPCWCGCGATGWGTPGSCCPASSRGSPCSPTGECLARARRGSS